ncbi:MAG: tetratricopeptide repeat protein [Cyanobacteria bacterium]|nr:tetratricopeptide repeat protein [Cyanobacteriota bacterium]
MPPSRPQIRAFLSSTFSDFLEERSLLVKQVFPALRRKAKDRGVEVVEVDLRWGITEEQSKQGQTIGICLDEIERCRPYFIGLLGDRYGWVPEKTDYRPELLRRQDWLPQHQGNASVTELEILHGVLNNPEMAGRAFFYFRDPAYSNAKAAEGTGWRCKTPEERQKLEALKQRIRDSGFPVVEGLATPEAIAEQIEADLWSLIEEQYPEAVKTDALALETARHASYRADRTGLYLGGEVYITQLQDWISAGEQRILITGESGAGKSALMANWVGAHESSQPDDVIFCHHLGSSNDASALRPLLARMIDSASRLLADELSEPLKVPQDWWELVTQVTNTLSRLSTWAIRHQRRWIWVLDGLDKLDLDDQQALPWLPLVLPDGVYLVASALDCPIRTLLQERIYATLTIGPLGEAEREQLIQKYLSLYTKELVPALRQKITSHQQGSSPLFLRVLLEELRLCGKFETLAEQLQGYLTAESVADLYELVLQRLEDDGHGDAVQKVMTALWASRAGLSENELLDFTGLAPVQWAPIGIGLQEALSEANGRLVFGHDFLRQAVRDRYLPTEEQRRQAHSELADWFEAQEGWDERKAEEWPWELQQSIRFNDLLDLLLDVNLLCQLVNDVGSREVLSYWQAVRPVANGELDELIEEAIENEIDKRREDPKKLIWFVDSLAELFDKAGLYRELLLGLRSLSLKLEEASEDRSEEAILNSLDWLAGTQQNHGNAEHAEVLYLRCLEAREKLLGREHPDTLATVGDLARLFQEKGDYEQAEELYQRCLEAQERLLVSEHPNTLRTVGNLASLYQDKGDFDRAESLYQRCLEARERLLGREHTSSLVTVGNLALLYQAKGNYELALSLYQRCIEARERLLGPEHPITFATIGNLAGLYQDLGNYDQAEALYLRNLVASDRLLGSEHPRTLATVGNLALLYQYKGNYEQAEALYQRDLKASERLLGPEHPSTLATVGNLALLYQYQGNYEQAEALNKRCLEARERLLGREHPNTLTAVHNLALVYRDKGDYVQAEALYQRCLEARERLLGQEHPTTLATVGNLALLYQEQGDYEKAEAFYQRCLEARERLLGREHPDTNSLYYALAELFAQTGRRQEAIPLRRREISWCQAQNGDTDPGTLQSINQLAIDLREVGELEEAEALFRRLVVDRQQVFEPGDFDIGRALGGLAKAASLCVV